MPLASIKGFLDLISLMRVATAIDASVGFLIALSVAFYLHRNRTGYRSTDNMINRIIILTVSTGLLPNVLSLLCFIFVSN